MDLSLSVASYGHLDGLSYCPPSELLHLSKLDSMTFTGKLPMRTPHGTPRSLPVHSERIHYFPILFSHHITQGVGHLPHCVLALGLILFLPLHSELIKVRYPMLLIFCNHIMPSLLVSTEKNGNNNN